MPTLKQGDTTPEFSETLTDEQGEPVELTESDSVRFYMEAPTSGTDSGPGDLIVDAAMSVDYTASEVTYDFQSGDTSRLGDHLAEVVVTFADGEVRTFPDDGYFTVTISEPTNRDVPPSETDRPDIEVGVVTADQVTATTAVLQEASVASAPAAAEDVTRQVDLDGHAGETDIHHTRYTDTDAQDALSGHTNDADAHHAQTQSSDIDHANISNVQSDQHHSKTTSASDLSDVSADSVSDAHHTKTTDTRTDVHDSEGVVVADAEAVEFLEAGAVGILITEPSDGAARVVVSASDTQLSTQDVLDAVGGEAINPDTIGADSPTQEINTEQLSISGTYHYANNDSQLTDVLSEATTSDTIILGNGSFTTNRTFSTGYVIAGTGSGDLDGSTSIDGASWTFEGRTVVRNIGLIRGSATLTFNASPSSVQSCNVYGDVVANADQFLYTGNRGGSVTFASGTADGLVDGCVNTSVTDNGSNTTGTIG